MLARDALPRSGDAKVTKVQLLASLNEYQAKEYWRSRLETAYLISILCKAIKQKFLEQQITISVWKFSCRFW